MTPHVHVYRLWQCQSNSPPRITPPTPSAARVRQEANTPGDGKSIGAEANPKLVQTDAREGARPLEQKDADADASQNCVGTEADKVFGSGPLPAAYLSPYARSLGVLFIDRSLKPALAVQGLITPDGCLA